MWLYAFLRGKKRIRCCNHWSIIIGDTEYEAIGRGVVKRPYNISGHQYVKEWKIDSPYEADVKRFLDDQVGKKYEVLNFIFHILKIWFGGWLGSYNQNQYSCIELVNTALQVGGISLNLSKWSNPYESQVWFDQAFKGEVIKDKEPSAWSTFMYYSQVLMWIFAIILIIVSIVNHTIFKDIIIRSFF
jgi:hypothetical protein